mgnify:CR=1 FL=1
MVEAKAAEPVRPYWFERLGMKEGVGYNVALRLLTEKLEALEARLANLEKAASSPGMMDK